MSPEERSEFTQQKRIEQKKMKKNGAKEQPKFSKDLYACDSGSSLPFQTYYRCGRN